jgi:hypothetical protein
MSPAIVDKYLAGIHFSAEKKNLGDQAKGNDAPEAVMAL